MGKPNILSASPLPTRRILVVDDDPELRQLMVRKLTHAGFEVLSAASGPEALAFIDHQGLPHLAITDINMPGMTGLEFCETVQQFSDLPIIMVTAVNEAATTIKAIRLYAEDYMVKPFNLDELVARVQRVLRRMSDFSYTKGGLVQISRRLQINFARKLAVIDGTEVELTPTETKIAYILWGSGGRVVTNEYLLSRLWPEQDMFEDNVRVHVHRLRHKLQGATSTEKYILTVRGQGYRFVVNETQSQ
jgi:DNA-binding response OmpR family regulator